MNGHDALVAVVVTLGLVVVIALLKSREVRARIQPKSGLFELQTKARTPVAPQTTPGSPKKRVQAPQDTRAWISRHWRAVAIASLILTMIVAPSYWWFSQREFWRMLVSDRLREAFNALLQGSDKPLEKNTGKETLDQLERVLRVRITRLERNGAHPDEIWIVDQHWHFWLSDLFLEYRLLNREFVLKGGRIHRLFVLEEKDFQDPELDKMLREQCDIAWNSAKRVTSDHFELWLARPGIKSSEPYKQVAGQVGRSYGQAAAFETFDALQFEDAFYFSNSFNTSKDTGKKKADPKEFLGSSTWSFDPAQIGEIHLDVLFKAMSPVADEFKCDQFETSFKAAKERAAAVR